MRFISALTMVALGVTALSPAAEPAGKAGAKPLVDMYGDPLPPRAIMRLGTGRLRQESFIWDAALSPNGKMLASAAPNQDLGIALWEVPSGRLLRRLIPRGDHPPWTYTLAFSPDGQKLLAGDVKGSIHLWDVAGGEELYSIAGHGEYPGVTAVAFSRDGRWMASGGADFVVRVWSTDGGRELLSFDMLPQPQENRPEIGYAGPPQIAALTFSPDGHLLAAGIPHRSDQTKTGKIRVWDLEANQPVSWLDQHNGVLQSLTFTPDGRRLISGGSVEIPRKKVSHPDYAPTMSVVQTRIWDVASGEMVRELATPQPEVGSGALALSSDGRTLAAGYEFKILIWDVESARIRRSIDVPPQWRGGRGLAISADGRTVGAPLASNTMGLWSTSTGELLAPKADGHTGTVLEVAYAGDGGCIATCGGNGDAAVRLWNAGDGRQRWAKTFHGTAYVHVMAVSPDGALIAAAGSAEGGDAGVRILKTATGDEVRFIPMFAKRYHRDVYGLAFSPDSRLVAVAHDRLKAGDGDIGLYELASGKRLAAILPEISVRYPRAMVFSRDGASLLTVNQNAAVHLWDTATGKLRREFTALKPPPDAADGKREKSQLASARFAPDVKTLVTSQGRELVIWDVERGGVVAAFDSESGDQGGGIQLSHDGRLLAMIDRHFSGTDAIRIFDLQSRRRIASFYTGQGRPRAFAFSPDGRRLVSGMEDGSALVWDLTE